MNKVSCIGVRDQGRLLRLDEAQMHRCNDSNPSEVMQGRQTPISSECLLCTFVKTEAAA